ncbi:MAG: glycosyltransferase, partial [Terracidiphilus sp.]
MDKELVSIIMPAFNAERFIAKALESVRAQTYKHWELIVTNDGGTDGTPPIVSTFAKNVAQTVVLIQHQHALGPSAARNSGM